MYKIIVSAFGAPTLGLLLSIVISCLVTISSVILIIGMIIRQYKETKLTSYVENEVNEYEDIKAIYDRLNERIMKLSVRNPNAKIVNFFNPELYSYKRMLKAVEKRLYYIETHMIEKYDKYAE